jgi:hypothetical protein
VTGSVSEDRARQWINTLTYCQGIQNMFSQRGLSLKDGQHTHPLSRDQQWVRSVRFKLDRGSTDSHPVKDGHVQSARIELDKGSTHSPAVRGSATHSVNELGLDRGSTHSHPVKGPITHSVN